jgi:hypothetical protein
MKVERHQLNRSKSKSGAVFAQADRLPRVGTRPVDKFYNLPDMKNKRACSFGYGSKSRMHLKTEAPAVGTYRTNDFVHLLSSRKMSFGLGRDKVVGGPITR